MRSSSKVRLVALFSMILSVSVFPIGTIGMFQRQEPFYTWYYCFAWWPYIVFVEAFLYLRGGNSTLFMNPRRFLTRLPLSLSVWLIFEAINFRLDNWHYISLPAEKGIRWLGYSVSFATVFPALFTTQHLLEYFGIFRYAPSVSLRGIHRHFGLIVGIGTAFLILPLLWPQYFFPLIWIGFIFFLDPLNYVGGGPSLFRKLEQKDTCLIYLLLLAGAVCGFLWEFWNYWAGSKWFYTIPCVGWLKVFEMPFLGYLGFPFFALECFVIENSFFIEKSRVEQKWSPSERRSIWICVILAVIFFDVLIFLGIDHFTVVSFSLR